MNTLTSCGALRPPADLDRDARAFMGVLTRNRLDSALALARLEGDRDTIRKRLEEGRDFVTPFAVDSAELVGWNVVTTVDTRGTLKEILVGPAHENDGRLNLFGALRTSMATCGYETVKEFQKAEVMVAPALQTEGKLLQRSQGVGMG